MKIFIDVGCNEGYYSLVWIKDPNNIVYAFEPEPSLYENLKLYEKEYKNFKVFPFAISEIDGNLTFFVSNNLVASSLKNLVVLRGINTN